MLARLLSPDYRRRRLAEKLPAGPLRAFLSAEFPAPRADARQTGYVALDLETTGLDPQRDEIISVGLVCLEGSRIDLATARHWLVSPTRHIPEASAIIHQITDDKAAGGAPLGEVLAEILPILAGRVLIAHHARMEMSFLDAACQRLFGGAFTMPVVDTEQLARRWLDQRNRTYAPKALRLGSLRQRYNLPRYRAHNALSDALSAAELFVAQLAERDAGGHLPLKAFLLRK